MSAPIDPIQSDENLNDPRFYAPPWARKLSLPAAGQPQYTRSPSVDSADNATTEPHQQRDQSRMPTGVGGPNIPRVPKMPPRDEAFTGDLAIQALRRSLLHEPHGVPHPPIVIERERSFLWLGGFGFASLTAAIAAIWLTALSKTDVYPPTSNIGDRVSAVSGFTPTAHSNNNLNVTAARFVVKESQATANDAVLHGVSLNNSSGWETAFLSRLEDGRRLTAGTSLGCTPWNTPGRELGAVLAYAPVGYVGAMHAGISLHAANNAMVDPRVIRLEWAPKVEQPMSLSWVVVVPPVQPLEQSEIDRLIKRGHQLLQSGDIVPAGLMLRRAALAGSAQAALALGGTYDPEVLREIGALGFASNPALAREWYQKALELGASEAPQRLERLASSLSY